MKIWMKFGKSSTAAVVVCMALFVAMPVAAAHQNMSTVSVVPINGKVDGRTYGKWSEVWWQQAFSVTTFEDCAQMNKNGGSMFFLAGTVVLPNPTGGTFTRSCTIPSGKFIMFPILNAEWSQAEALATQPGGACLLPGVTPSGTDYAALSACTKALIQAGLPGGTFAADVDGIPLDLTNQEAASPHPLFPIEVVANNPFCPLLPTVLCPLKSKSAADGIWIILNPLSAGNHIIHLHLEVPVFGLPPTNVIYNLTVQ